jgi:O-antigen ligase
LTSLWPHLLGAWCLALLAILQERSLYFAVPMAALLLTVASRQIGGAVVKRFSTGLVVAVIVLFLVAPLIPSGRVGTLSPQFFLAHALTAFGGEGPAAGTIDDRNDWREDIMRRVTSQWSTVVVGLGPGPDLLNGFVGIDGQLIRKPHNDYLEMFARYGIFGLGFWLGFIFLPLARIWSAVRQPALPGEDRRFLLWVLTLCAIYLLVSAVQPLMSFPYGTITVFTTLGMGLAVAKFPSNVPSPVARGSGGVAGATRGMPAPGHRTVSLANPGPGVQGI